MKGRTHLLMEGGGGSPVSPSEPRGATTGKAVGSPDKPLPSRGRTFQSTSSGAAYVGGICSLSRGGGVNEVSSVGGVAGWEGEGLRRA